METAVKLTVLVIFTFVCATGGQIALLPQNAELFAPNTNPNNITVGITCGWEFSTSAPITITALGLSDTTYGLVGLAESHALAIWDSTGTQLVSGIVSAGSLGTGPDTSNGESKVTWVSVTPVTLPQGTYVIGAFFPSNSDLMWGGYRPYTTVETALPISYVEGVFDWTTANTLIFPTIDYLPEYTMGYFGPNFQFETNTVPEPSTLAAITVGLILLLTWRHTRRKQRAHEESAAPRSNCSTGLY